MTQFEEQISIIEHATQMVENYKDLQETAGYLVSTQYYKKLNAYEQENLGLLQQEYADLTASLEQALSEGRIERFSSAWYEMVGDINSTEEAILDAKKALVEYDNAMRELEWGYFDTLQDYIGNVITEAEFLTDLFSDYHLYEEAGAFTDLGKASVGLAAIRNNVYMEQADAYRDEMMRVNEELAKDPNNTILINRREELLELQQKSIAAAQDEKQAIKSLVSEGYEVMLDFVSKIIDRYKDALQAEKDMYDYQKNIAEQTKNIANLQKQLDALSGDDSEENRNRLQQLRNNLEEAQQNLQETEYERYISDQEKMLDTFYNDLETWVNNRLDNFELIVREQIDATNQNADLIRETISLEAGNVGYNVSTALAESLDSSRAGSLGNIVGYYGEEINVTEGQIYAAVIDVSSGLTSTVSALNDIKAKIEEMIHASDLQSQQEIAATNAIKEAQQTPTPGAAKATAAGGSGAGASATGSGAGGTGTSSGSSSASASSTGGGSSSKWGSWFVSKKDTYSKSKLDKDTSIVDRLRYLNIDPSFERRKAYYAAMGGSGTYTGSAAQNKWMIAQMKAHGYRRGTSFASGGNAWTQERGTELIFRKSDGAVLTPLNRGDAVFTSAMTKNLWDIAKNMDAAKMRAFSVNRTGGDVIFDGDIQMFGVNDPVQFAENLKSALKNDERVKKIIQSQTLGVAMGKNSLASRRY